MRLFLTIACCLYAQLSVGTPVKAQGWRGIVPLHSSRADVERLLGPPAKSGNEYMSAYRLDGEGVIFNYEGERPCEGSGGWRVPPGTVVSILVTPRSTLRFADLKVDESRYKKSTGGHRPEDVIYTDAERGESFTVYQGEVTSISHFPTVNDSHLRCPAARTPR